MVKSNGGSAKRVRWSLENLRFYGRSLLVICPRCGELGRLYYNKKIGWYIKHKSNKTHHVKDGEPLEVPLLDKRLNLITYVGGDTFLLPYLAKMVPPHEAYVEVFGGGGVFLLNKPPSKVEVYNDIDGNLVNLFRVVKEHPDEFQREFEFLLYSRQQYYEFIDKYRKGDWRDDIERAVGWFYLLRASYAGKLLGGFATGVKRNMAKSFFNAVDEVKRMHKRLRNVVIESLDFREVIKRYDSPKTFFYCDPPHLYLSTDAGSRGDDYYRIPFTDADYMDLLQLLEKVEGKFLLKQSTEVPFLLEWAKQNGFYITRLVIKKAARSDPRGERCDNYPVYFIANYPLRQCQ